jgi:hypothetical protein
VRQDFKVLLEQHKVPQVVVVREVPQVTQELRVFHRVLQDSQGHKGLQVFKVPQVPHKVLQDLLVLKVRRVLVVLRQVFYPKVPKELKVLQVLKVLQELKVQFKGRVV